MNAIRNTSTSGVFSALAVNAIESFNVSLYGFFSVIIFSKYYFPSSENNQENIYALMIYSLSFVMRPIGSALMGKVGDYYGRKHSLYISLVIVTVPSILISLLPTYNDIGLMASFLLVALLMVQGIGAAASHSGASVFITEHVGRQRAGLASSLIFCLGFSGGLLCTLTGAFFTMPSFPEYFWRYTFAIGGFFGFFSLYIARYVQETPAFKKLQQQPDHKKISLRRLFKTNYKKIIIGAGLAVGSSAPYTMTTAYLNTIMVQYLPIANNNILILNAMTMATWIILLPLFGIMADRIGRFKQMRFALFMLAIGAVPCFYYLQTHLSLTGVLLTIALLSLVGTAYLAPSIGYISHIFDVKIRQTAVGISYSIGICLFGASSPLIGILLNKWMGLQVIVGGYLVFISFICLTALCQARKIVDKDILRS